MHEVSFQDKEKEHLTRLQDAEEVKVSVCTSGMICPQTCACQSDREKRTHGWARCSDKMLMGLQEARSVSAYTYAALMSLCSLLLKGLSDLSVVL